MKEFFLGAFLAREELDVVDQQRPLRAIVALEVIDGVLLQRPHHVRDKAFGVQIGDPGAGFLREDRRAYGVHEMGLAKADAAGDEQRVVALTGVCGDLQRGGPRELVGFSLDEGVKGLRAIEIAVRPRLGFAVPGLDRARGPRPLGRLFRLILAADLKPDPDFLFRIQLAHQFPYPRHIMLIDPVEHEPVRRQQADIVPVLHGLQRTYPGIEKRRG